MPIGITELLIIAGVIVLLFGTSKIPKLGLALGETIRNLRSGFTNTDEDKH